VDKFRLDEVKRLLELGADPEPEAVIEACKQLSLDILVVLVEKGAPVSVHFGGFSLLNHVIWGIVNHGSTDCDENSGEDEETDEEEQEEEEGESGIDGNAIQGKDAKEKDSSCSQSDGKQVMLYISCQRITPWSTVI